MRKKGILCIFLVFLSVLFLNFTGAENILEEESTDVLLFRNSQTNEILVRAEKIYNTDECLIDCSTRLNITLYTPMTVFDDMVFENPKKRRKHLTHNIKYQIVDRYDRIVNEYGNNCAGISPTVPCTPEIIGTHEEEIITYDWKKYNGEVMPGNENGVSYIFIVEAKKGVGEDIDWSFSMANVSSDSVQEYWDWWNNSWTRKQNITLTSSDIISRDNVSVLLNVSFDNDMQPDFDDLRFLDAEEDDELSYWFYNNTYFNASYVQVWVKLNREISNTQNVTVMMYYGNPNVITASNITNAFLFGDNFDANWDYTNIWYTANESKHPRSTLADGTTVLTMNGEADDTFYIGVRSEYGNLSGGYIVESRNLQSTNGNGQYMSTVQQKRQDWDIGDAPTSLAMSMTTDGRFSNFLNGFNWLGSNGDYVANVWYRLKTELQQNGSAKTSAASDINVDIVSASGTLTRSPVGRIGYHVSASGTANQIDWVYARRFVQNEPISSFGEEEVVDLIAPEVTAQIISPVNPIENDNLICNATLTDNVTESLSANWRWYKNGVLNLSGTKTEIENSTNINITTLLSGNTTKGENWTCGVTPNDGVNLGDENNVTVTIGNTAPSVPVQLLPVNASGYAMGSTITFVWNNSNDMDGDTLTYDLYIYNESDMAAANLVHANTSITEGTDNTTISIKLSDYGATDDDYYWYIRADDGDNVSDWSSIRTFQYANWTITFNVTELWFENPLNNIEVFCSNGWDSSGFPGGDANSPFNTDDVFIPGQHNCTFVVSGYFDNSQIFLVDEAEIINVEMTPIGGVTPEEHTWLEAIYDCIIGGDCTLYDMISNINDTVADIWEHVAPTDESVVLTETVTNKVVNATNNLTIDYSVSIPIKAGYNLGAYLPVRIGYFFLDSTNTTCYNQGEELVGVNSPTCTPLIIETIGPMGGTVDFTVELQPALVSGNNYSIKRIIDIDPLGVWYNYGSEIISDLTMLESLSLSGASVERTGDNLLSGNNAGSNTNTGETGGSTSGSSGSDSNSNSRSKVVYIKQDSASNTQNSPNAEDSSKQDNGIIKLTGAAIGVGEKLFNGSQLIVILAILCATFVIFTLVRSKTSLKVNEYEE